MTRKSDPELEPRLPLDLSPRSNGEFEPAPKSADIARVERVAWERIEENARKKGVSRRTFVQSSCGVASVLVAMNQVLGCGGSSSYRVEEEAELDEEAANASVGSGAGGDELIFDVQTHRVSTDRDWWRRNDVFHNLASARGACGDSWIDCYTTDNYIREIFLESDTDMAVLSAVPGGEDELPLHAREAAETRETVDRMDGDRRLLIHGIPQPAVFEMSQVLEHMVELKERWDVAAWKLYPVWGPDGTGWWLDDEDTGVRVVEQARSLGLPLLAIHKGLPQPGMDPTYSRPRDVGPIASAYPDVKLLIYHSAYWQDRREGPYDPTADEGVDALIRTCEEHGVGPNGNVYAELGVLWRELRTKPEQAAHTLGKLLVHLGEDRILWGTDCIWFGSPQEQIASFRAFEIPARMQEEFGYPALTPARKAKILGLNALGAYGIDADEARASIRGDAMSRAKRAYVRGPRPLARGPRTRRELVSILRSEGRR